MEKMFKRALWGFLNTLFHRGGTAPALPLDFNKIRSVLVIRPDRLGDVVLSTPVYASLKKSFSGVEVTALVDRAYKSLLADDPNVDRTLVFNKRNPIPLIKNLIAARFDVAITLNRKFSATAAAMAFFSGARWRVNYKTDEGAWLYNVQIPPRQGIQHETQNNLDLIRALGAKNIQEAPRIFFNPEEEQKTQAFLAANRKHPERPLVLVKPGTRVPAWGWKLEKFRTVCERLMESGRAEVFIICGPGEKEMVDSLFDNPESKPFVLPPLSLKELAGLIAKCDLLFCNHTGIMHLASALQTPLAVIFKHGQIERWGPCHTRSMIFEERNGDFLTPEEVVAGLDKMLS